MNHSYSGRVSAILAVLVIALLAIFSPSVANPHLLFDRHVPFLQKTNLKPGIDISGGTSLIYQIRQPEGARPDAQLAEHVMQALKRRVDPTGTLNLIWRPQGADRLEIQMPLAATAGESAQKQKAMDDARAQLAATNISVSDAIDALRGQNGKTRADFDKMVVTAPPSRQKSLKSLGEAFDALNKAREAHDAAAGEAAQARFDAAQKDLEKSNLTPAEMDGILALKASRAARLAQIRQEAAQFPERLAAINAYQKAAEALQHGGGSLESAADLKRLLRGSGVLEFHILATAIPDSSLLGPGGYQAWVQRLKTNGPRLQAGDHVRWYETDRPEEFRNSELYNDRRYVLLSIRPEDSLDPNSGKWALTGASIGNNPQSGETVVDFEFDTIGAALFGKLTTDHKGQPMAIVLDNKVISAPNINTAITGGRGQITGGGEGGFTHAESDYLVRMLSAGSLPAQLDEEPISERTVGPQLGEDNLNAGLASCGFGLIVVAIFLIGYYYRAGVVAFTAVLMNIVLILGAMAAINATFTLPGIAAIVLTIGTAVDANVLVFERLREEEMRGLPLRMALRNAYDRAFSAIVDSNMTTIITSFFLIMFGTEEVKGFGITLIIGILMSLFTALFVTRTIFGIMIDTFGVRKLGSVPLSFPKWDKLLRPHIDWMGLAWIFYTFSAIVLVAGLFLFYRYTAARQMMDIEFASGTAVTFELKQPIDQGDVRRLLEDEAKREPNTFPAPSVVRIGNDNTTWEVTTPYADARKVRDDVLQALAPLGTERGIKTELPSKFQGVGEKLDEVLATQSNVIIPIIPENTGVAAKWPGGKVPEDVKKYPGGAAIALRGLDPPLSANQIKLRLDRQTLQAKSGNDQSATAAQDFTVVTNAAPEKPVTDAVVLTGDDALPYDKDKAKWQDGVVAPMWRLINDAVAHPAELQQVKNFDASVAGDTQRDALVALILSVLAIMAYIWIRFGNLKYGTATVIALLHDVLFTIAGLGFAHLLANTFIGTVLRLEPFRISLTVVAGILTIMGYSMIDTIVVFDRIRENRGKYGHLSRQVVNDAINQTLSRTILTAGTTLVMVTIMYFLGGSGIHGFTFVLLVGILVGTYSSVAIASPFLLLGKDVQAQDEGRESPATGAKGSKVAAVHRA